MTDKQRNRSQLKAALKALKLKHSQLLAWKEYGDRVVVVTRSGQKLSWQARTGEGK